VTLVSGKILLRLLLDVFGAKAGIDAKPNIGELLIM
jgi:hypothetical protein